MKSNEEFIAGIYQKAELLQNHQHREATKDNIIPIHSFSQKVRKFSAYAAGVAACFLCGVLVMREGSLNRMEEASQAKESRNLDSDSAQAGIEPAALGLDEESAQAVSKWENVRLIQAVVEEVTQDNGLYIITLISDGSALQKTGKDRITISLQDTAAWAKAGTSIVVSVYDDKEGTAAIVPDSIVYLYQSTEDGEKVYAAPDGSVIRESEIH